MADWTHENDPYARYPVVPALAVTSTDVRDGEPLPPALLASSRPGGRDRSPQIAWGAAPHGTRSIAVTFYDPDAPTGSGLWHWVVANIPATVAELPPGAGDPSGAALPPGALRLPNDMRVRHYVGAAPPVGHGRHRYFLAVHALDVLDIGVEPDGTPAVLGFAMVGHTLARGVLIGTAESSEA